jgi:hypothetical protein
VALQWLLNQLRAVRPRPEEPGGDFVRPYGRYYEFPVVYLENDRYDALAPRWLAFTAAVAAKQGPSLAPCTVHPYFYPTLFDGGGATRAQAWTSLRARLLEVIADEHSPRFADWFAQCQPRLPAAKAKGT